jgi:hypothetical protein
MRKSLDRGLVLPEFSLSTQLIIMKKICLTLITILSIVQLLHAQWSTIGSNTTTTNNVGIGTTAPAAKLDVVGGSAHVSDGSNNIIRLRTDDPNRGIVDFTNTAQTLYRDATIIGNSLNLFGNNGTGLYINSSGNIGIGTTNPAEKFSTIGADNVAITNIARFFSNNLSQSVGIGYQGLRQTAAATLIDFNAGTSGIIYLGNASTGGTNIGLAGGNTILNATAGNTGIGSISPLALLSVGSGSLTDNNVPIQVSTSGTNTVKGIGFNKNGGYGLYMGYDQGVVTTGGFIRQISTDPLSVIVNNTTPAMTFLSSGNVLIGKTSQTNSTYQLDVAGSIRSGQMVVNTTGADFVFDPAYRLSALSDIKKYIDQYHHLPGIPSAEEMQKSGLDVGDNQMKLLQKVEELSLYLIEKDQAETEQKEINRKQSEQLKSQQKQIDELKTRLEFLIKSK